MDRTACIDAVLGVSTVVLLDSPEKMARRFSVQGTDNRGQRLVEWSGPERLREPDQTLLLVLQKFLKPMTPIDPSCLPKPLRRRLGIRGRTSRPVLFAEIHWTDLVEALGKKTKGGRTIRLIAESLTRLAGITVATTVMDTRETSRLIAWDSDPSVLRIALCPRMSGILIEARRGNGRGRFSVISLSERSRLPSAAARLLHCWLSCWMGTGQTRRIRLSTLESHIWADSPHATNLGRRRAALRRAIADFKRLKGWKITAREGMATITRTAAPACIDGETASQDASRLKVPAVLIDSGIDVDQPPPIDSPNIEIPWQSSSDRSSYQLLPS
jgi:hypothetical protein